MNIMQEWHTLTGLSLGEAVKQLKAVLPPSAYKAVPGSQGLTDIDPSYLTEKATEIFGPAGIGWFYQYDTKDLEIGVEQKVSSKGREYTEYGANLLRFLLFVRFVVDGEIRTSEPIPATGGNANEVRAYAIRGTLTNALGAAFAKLCWQLPVYQGLVSHQNADRVYKAVNGANGAQTTTGKNAVSPSTPATSEAPSAVQSNAQTSTILTMTIEQADSLVMHLAVANKALRNKSLGELKKSEEGRKVIKHLAETWQATGGGDQDQRLKEAAKLISASF